MPLPLKPEENVYIDHLIKDGTYSMPTMQAASDHYAIGYIVSGDRRWISTEMIRTTHGGDAAISKPHVYHRNCSMSDVPYDRYLIKIRIETFQPIIDIIGEEELNVISSNYLHFSKESQKIICSMLEEMLKEYEKNSPYSQLLLQGMVYKLFFYLYENHIPSEYDEHIIKLKEFDERIHKSLIYVEDNLMSGTSIEETAAYVSLSPSHFSRLFKQVTGSSYTDYLTDVRLQHAQILLGTGNLSISEIAARVGVANGNYLCTLFKKRYGVTPTGYRKEIRKHLND
ncbi:MAG: AraC family transcriptional regulator [Lachnospiraceae bacterium]|nr:AraC family transcriptional regulator [Lachnospiraceae bacterium]